MQYTFINNVDCHANNTIHESQQKFLETTSATMTAWPHGPRNTYYVNILKSWKKNTNIIGHATYSIYEESPDICSIDIYLLDLAWQGRGLASITFKELVRHVLSDHKGVSTIILEVHCDNHPAVHVYRRCGFRSIGTRDKFITMKYEKIRDIY